MQTLVESEVRRVGRRVFSSLDHPRQVTFDLDFRVSDARYQRAQASLRRRVGRLRKHHSGGYAYGAPPTGYRAVGGQLVPDPAGQRALERARELRAAGASLRTIAAALTAEGHPTKRGGRWQPTQVSRLLRRSEGKAPAT